MNKTKTESQHLRNKMRGTGGRYTPNPCDLCGKGCPVDGPSDARCNSTVGGWGVRLHERCAVKLEGLTDSEYSQMAAFSQSVKAW